MTIAVCPGSYDPVTAGHLDVIERVLHLFGHVHAVVAINGAKHPLFSEGERVEMIRASLREDGYDRELEDGRITVASTQGLITTYCKQVGASVIVKGLRQGGDYDMELGQALVNRCLGDIETMFLPADPMKEHISSTIVKDVARYGGDISGMVPDVIIPRLTARLSERGLLR